MEQVAAFWHGFDADIKRGLFWIVLISLHCLQSWLDKGKNLREKLISDIFTSPGSQGLRSFIFLGYGVGMVDLLMLTIGKPSFLFGN